jgi:hypothetical protein
MTNNTTDKKTQGVPLRKEASADDPIYSRGFSIGTRHSVNSSPDTTQENQRHHQNPLRAVTTTTRNQHRSN